MADVSNSKIYRACAGFGPLLLALLALIAPADSAAAEPPAPVDETGPSLFADQAGEATEAEPPNVGRARLGKGGPMRRMRERYPGDVENEYQRYPMGLGIERQPNRLWMLPMLNYTTDLGAGYGLLTTWRVKTPSKVSSQGVRAVMFYSALDAALVRLQWERTPGAYGVHLLADASWQQIYTMPYFGVGNAVSPELPKWQGLTTAETEALTPYFTSLTERRSYVALIAQRGLNDPKRRVFSVIRVRHYEVDAFDRERVSGEVGFDPGEGYQSLLEAQSPYGADGGWAPWLQVGGMMDSRKTNINPMSGAFHEFSVRGVGYATAGERDDAYSPFYAGVNVTLRRYVTLFGHWVLASRLVGDATFGDVPVFDLATFGASDPYTGLGGTLAGRGLALNHFIGKVKVLWGPELRYSPFSRTMQGGQLDLSFAVFADSGRVWKDWEQDGEGVGLHTGVGAGVRMIWAHRVLLRLDVATGIQDSDPLGVYLVFGHPY